MSSLGRVEPVGVSTIVESFKRQHAPAIEVWLEFQERYAGFVEQLGCDRVVWGLAHTQSDWQASNEVWLERDQAGVVIACADAHPSYDYWLTEVGEFTGRGGGGPCESFQIKVEQSAILWDCRQTGSWMPVLDLARWATERRDEAILQAKSHFVIEASDKYTTCWASPEWLLFDRGNSGLSLWKNKNRTQVSDPER